MSPLALTGAASAAALALGFGLAGGFSHLARLRAERARRRRPGQGQTKGRTVQVRIVADASDLERKLRQARRELERLARVRHSISVSLHLDGREIAREFARRVR